MKETIEMQVSVNGLIDLTDEARKVLSKEKYFNNSLAPTKLNERNWNSFHICMCWIGMNICIPAYQMASSAIALGLSWWISLSLVFLGNLIILVPIQLNSKVGTKYGIPFPIYSRLSFGIKGAQIPNVLRSIIGAAWTSILIWIGAEAIQVAMEILFPSWATFKYGQTACFIFFWLLNIGIAYGGAPVLKKFESLGSPLLLIICIFLFVWGATASKQAGYSVLAPLLSLDNDKNIDIGRAVILCLVANISYYSTWALNIPDLSRYAKNQKTQFKGQIIGLPFSMMFIALVGIYVTGASKLLFGTPMWNPNDIVRHLDSKLGAFISAFAIMLATLTTNVTTNILPPSNGFSNVCPQKISYKTGVIITGMFSFIIQPWRLVSDPSGYIYDWLGTYGILTGGLAGIYIYDYFVLRKQQINLAELYSHRNSSYWYFHGFNITALLAWVGSISLPLLGKIIPSINVFASYGWFISFFFGIILYAIMTNRIIGRVNSAII